MPPSPSLICIAATWEVRSVHFPNVTSLSSHVSMHANSTQGQVLASRLPCALSLVASFVRSSNRSFVRCRKVSSFVRQIVRSLSKVSSFVVDVDAKVNANANDNECMDSGILYCTSTLTASLKVCTALKSLTHATSTKRCRQPYGSDNTQKRYAIKEKEVGATV